ncbi:unnamed protein product, partial [Amoebophrya sp. A25]|eukprot:GSA25T00005823001.1
MRNSTVKAVSLVRQWSPAPTRRTQTLVSSAAKMKKDGLIDFQAAHPWYQLPGGVAFPDGRKGANDRERRKLTLY